MMKPSLIQKMFWQEMAILLRYGPIRFNTTNLPILMDKVQVLAGIESLILPATLYDKAISDTKDV